MKISSTVESFIVCGKFYWSSKLFCRKCDCRKVSRLWKSSLTVEKFLEKSSLYVEKLCDCEKLTFLTAEKIIDLKILKANANIEIMKRYSLNLEQKLSSLVTFVVDKISIIFSRWLNYNDSTFNAWQQQKFIDTKSNLQSKAVSLWKH